ncbi:MAG: DUF3035 domain-containing protein [Alphaproteobacteria bacterium]|nr:DUF3035 domain-containing protein [Alphaproteobacteria bacterium]
MRIHLTPLIITALLLTACEGNEVREAVGLTREAPDEFVVVSRPPLSVPPDFDLKPPRPGEIRAAESTENQAKKLILKDDGTTQATVETMEPAPKSVETALDPVISSDAKTSAESSFLGKLGAENADPEIRQKLGADITAPKDTSNEKSLLDKLTKGEGEEPIVDAKKEAKRIRKNKEKGKPINKGKVPEADESRSVIDKIF